jgi:superfamily II DNA or RNA helicase
MNLSFPVKEPDKAYISNRLWLPLAGIRADPVKRALEFVVNGGPTGQVMLRMWEQSSTHIICPREFLPHSEYGKFKFPFIDLRPDFQRVEFEEDIQPRDAEQVAAWESLTRNDNGILNLACVAGDTILNLNRGGKGFKVTIEAAFRKLNRVEGCKYPWDPSIPTYTRSDVGGHVGLNRVFGIVFSGTKMTTTLVLSDGRSLRLTEDHEVLTPEGWRLAGQLVKGSMVITDGDREGSIRKEKRPYKRSSWYPSHPHIRRQWREERQAYSYVIETHRAVYEAKLNGLTFEQYRSRCKHGDTTGLAFVDPSQFHIHHKDGNIYNNHPDNLEQLPKEEHLQGHRPGSRAFGYGDLVPVEVVAVHWGKPEPVYDVMCEAPHNNFVANGVVVHNCGKGKTILAVKKIAQRGVPTLVVVPDGGILSQWQEAIARHLRFDGELGLIQGPVFNWAKPVTLALVTTLWKRIEDGAIPEEVFRYFGQVIYDEVHQIGAPKFSLTAEQFYGDRIGLTATVQREDGLDPVYRYHIGEPFYSDLTQELIPDIVFQQTPARIPWEDARPKNSTTTNISMLRGIMGRDLVANVFRYWHIKTALDAGRKILAISHSVNQLKLFHALFPGSAIIIGAVAKEERMRILRESRLCFAIAKLGSTGVDDDQLDTLFWLTPFRSKIALQQSMGRIQRPRPGKRKPLMVVFEDWMAPPIKTMCNALKRELKSWGFKFSTIKPNNAPQVLPPEIREIYDRVSAELDPGADEAEGTDDVPQ